MTTFYYVYATAAVILALIASQGFRKSFDPFAPLWLFLVAYAQVYVFQALKYREYGLRVRGEEVLATADSRALWALLLFLAVYYLAPARRLAAWAPAPPRGWSSGAVALVSPLMVVWGFYCAGLAFQADPHEMTAGLSLLHNFAMVLLVAGIWLLITGRNAEQPRPVFTAAGVAIVALYVLIWMFNGKRSHSLIGVLTGVCAFYVPKYRRPSKPVLAATALAGALAVSLAIGWRGNGDYEHTFAGFFEYVGDFDPSNILVNINVKDRDEVDPYAAAPLSYETEEWGGYLLMLDTVPGKSDYDYGSPYLRLVTTFIPRMVWANKPLYGTEAWVNAWIAGSEFDRDETFTGPAVSLLGAAQLNGGVVGTVLVVAVVALLLRMAYEYFRLHADVPWVQAWWALTFYNAWMLVVNDNPAIWFYYNYGFTTFGPMVALFFYLKLARPRPAAHLVPSYA